MTTRRDQILIFIAEYVTDHHNAPSTYTVGQAFNICAHTAYQHMVKLCAEGRLQLIDYQWKIPTAIYTAPEDLQTPAS